MRTINRKNTMYKINTLRRRNMITWAAGTTLAVCLAGNVWTLPVCAADAVMLETEQMDTELTDTDTTEFPEAAPQISWKASSEIEDGILTIRIESSEYEKPEFWWQNRPMDDEDDSIVGLARMTESEGLAYCGDYRVLEDANQTGEDTIRLIYTNGFYTSEYMEWTVSVEDGKIMEVIGGGQAFASSATDFAPVLGGVWNEEGGSKTMEIQAGDNNSLEFTITDESAQDGEGTVYRMHAYYDAEKMTLVYWDGMELSADAAGDIEEQTADPENAGTGEFGVFPASADGEDETDVVIV